MVFLSAFFQYFGLFAFIGCIVLFFLIRKELKKQLPTAEEKQEMIKKNIITGKEKKKVLREKTLIFRYQKKIDLEVQNALLKKTQLKQ